MAQIAIATKIKTSIPSPKSSMVKVPAPPRRIVEPHSLRANGSHRPQTGKKAPTAKSALRAPSVLYFKQNAPEDPCGTPRVLALAGSVTAERAAAVKGE